MGAEPAVRMRPRWEAECIYIAVGGCGGGGGAVKLAWAKVWEEGRLDKRNLVCMASRKHHKHRMVLATKPSH